jgi:hypothetical protein
LRFISFFFFQIRREGHFYDLQKVVSHDPNRVRREMTFVFLANL